MKPYIHDPARFRAHFAGQGLPAFKGQRMQRGNGSWVSKPKRYAVPLLIAGTKAAAPHVSRATSQVAANMMQQAFPNNPAMQRVVGNVAGRVTDQVMGAATNAMLQKKGKRKTNARTNPIRRATRRNLFA